MRRAIVCLAAAGAIAVILGIPGLALAQDDNMGTFSGSTSSSGSSHEESSSASSSGSVTVGGGDSAGSGSGSLVPHLGHSGPPPGWPGHHDDDPLKPLAGSWTLGADGTNDTCGATLKDDKVADGLHYAWLATGCPEGFFKVTRWRSDGRHLDLADAFGQTYAHLTRVGRDRFEGQRASDNGKVWLSR